jgi:Zn-finger nucleic acid-binding protein
MAVICPACRDPLVIVETKGIELDVCAAGHGTWFDADELRWLLDESGAPSALRGLETDLAALEDAGAGRRRRCPRCGRRMVAVQAPGTSEDLVLDRCPEGDGLWFDAGELERLLASRFGTEHEALARVRSFLGEFRSPREGGGPP